MPEGLVFSTEVEDTGFSAGLRRMGESVGRFVTGAESRLDRFKKSINESTKGGGAMGGNGGHGGGSDFAWALRDMAEGRTGAGLVRLGDSVGVVGAAFAGAIGAIAVAKTTFEKFDEIADATTEANNKLTDSLVRLSEATAKMSIKTPVDQLEKQRQASINLLNEERKQQAQLSSESAMTSGASGSLRDAVESSNPMALYALVRDRLKNEASAEDKLKESKLREKIIGKDIGRTGALETQGPGVESGWWNKSAGSSRDEFGRQGEATKNRIEDQAKSAMEAMRGDEKNRLAVEDRIADAKEKLADDAAKNQRDLDEDNAKQQMANLKKRVEEGNKLYMDSIKPGSSFQKAQQEKLRESIARSNAALGISQGRFQEAQDAQTAFENSTPDERRSALRARHHEQSVGRRIAMREANRAAHPERHWKDARPGGDIIAANKKFAIENVTEIAQALAKELNALVVAP